MHLREAPCSKVAERDVKFFQSHASSLTSLTPCGASRPRICSGNMPSTKKTSFKKKNGRIWQCGKPKKPTVLMKTQKMADLEPARGDFNCTWGFLGDFCAVRQKKKAIIAHKHPGGPGTGPWLLKNYCFAVAPARFHVGNNHEKKNIRFSVVCNPCRVLCFKTRRTIKVVFSLHRMRDLTASPVAVSKSKSVCSHLHWWLRMYLNNKPLRLPWTWERMLSGIDFFINFQ